MITVTITGNLTDDPRSFSTRDGQPGCELRVAVDLPPRSGSGEGLTRYFKVVTFGVLASHAAASVRKGDRVTVQGYDLTSEAWVSDGGEPRSKVAIRAIEIAVSLRWDTLTTGRAVRNAAREAAKAADPQVPGGELRPRRCHHLSYQRGDGTTLPSPRHLPPGHLQLRQEHCHVINHVCQQRHRVRCHRARRE